MRLAEFVCTNTRNHRKTLEKYLKNAKQKEY